MSMSGTGLGPEEKPLGVIDRFFRWDRVLEFRESEEYDLATRRAS